MKKLIDAKDERKLKLMVQEPENINPDTGEVND